MDLEVFRSYLLNLTDLLTTETADLIEERPRFAHSVLILADCSLPGERLKANYVKQLDPLWVKTSPSTNDVPTDIQDDTKHDKTITSDQPLSNDNSDKPSVVEYDIAQQSTSVNQNANTYQNDENNNNGARKLKIDQQRPFKKCVISRPNLSSIEEVPTSAGIELFECSTEVDTETQQQNSNGKPQKAWFVNDENVQEEQHKRKEKESSFFYEKKQDQPRQDLEAPLNNNESNSSEPERDPTKTKNILIHEVKDETKCAVEIKNSSSMNSYSAKPYQFKIQPCSNEIKTEYVQHVYRQSRRLDYGVFPSEKREQYARWKANAGIDTNGSSILRNNLTEVWSESSTIVTETVDSSTVSTDNELPHDDPAISEAIRILEASCQMLNETSRKICAAVSNTEHEKQSAILSSRASSDYSLDNSPTQHPERVTPNHLYLNRLQSYSPLQQQKSYRNLSPLERTTTKVTKVTQKTTKSFY